MSAKGKPNFDLVLTDEDIQTKFELWMKWLRDEKGVSHNTFSAYHRDLRFFIIFISDHLGKKISRSDLENLNQMDFRSYLSQRTSNGISRNSLRRSISVLKIFFLILS